MTKPAVRADLKGILLIVLATACWSTSGVFIQNILERSDMTPVSLAFWRDIATFTVLLLGVGIVKPSLLKIDLKDTPWFAGMGIISIGVFHIFWNTNIWMNGVSIATVIQCNAPIFVTVMAWFLWREPFTGAKLGGIGLAVLGTVLAAGVSALGSIPVTKVGLLIGLGSAVTYGTYSLFGKRLTKKYSGWTIITYAFLFGTLTLLPFQPAQGMPGKLLPITYLHFAALVLLPTVVGFVLYTVSLQWVEASVAAIVATAEVAFAAFFSFIFLGERLDIWQVMGALFVIMGVIMVSVPKNWLDVNRIKKNVS